MVKLHTKHQEVLTFCGSWHGRTHATLSLSGMKDAKQGVYPLVPGAVFVPYPYCYRCPLRLEYPDCGLCCIDLVETAVRDSMSGSAEIAAMIVEPIQGYGGHIVPPDEFLSSLRKICDENNLVLIIDEIYTGFGRTGKMFAVEHYDIIPDIHIMGKGMTSCFPFSAVVGRSEIMDAGRGTVHSMTFQANPVLCAAAIASLKILQEEKLVESSAEKGRYFMKRLNELAEANEVIGDVRGKGLLIGVELVENRRTKEPALKKTEELRLSAARRGVIVDVAARSNILRITPPLVITHEQIDKAMNGLEAALRSLKHS
jgi:4-aminobutyrate aminotransferase-like enzyme